MLHIVTEYTQLSTVQSLSSCTVLEEHAAVHCAVLRTDTLLALVARWAGWALWAGLAVGASWSGWSLHTHTTRQLTQSNQPTFGPFGPGGPGSPSLPASPGGPGGPCGPGSPGSPGSPGFSGCNIVTRVYCCPITPFIIPHRLLALLDRPVVQLVRLLRVVLVVPSVPVVLARHRLPTCLLVRHLPGRLQITHYRYEKNRSSLLHHMKYGAIKNPFVT